MCWKCGVGTVGDRPERAGAGFRPCPLTYETHPNELQSADIDRMKHNALAARQTLNADVEMEKLVQLYYNLLEKDHHV